MTFYAEMCAARKRSLPVAAALALSLMPLMASSALAATPKDVLVEVGEQGPNALDPMAPAANEYSQMVAWQIYDRLVTHGTKTLPDGKVVYDATKIEPELATSWEISDDKKTLIFHLREDATFHDGTPVTADDVKWSFDRAIAAGGFPATQMAAGSFTDPNQFSVVDKYTFKITLPAPNKMSLPDLVVPVPNIVNKTLALKHATADDPWALEWTRNNDAGGGPFKVGSWKSGDQIVFDRFDDWKSGPLPAMKKVVYRQVASAGTRRALLEKGDVDISIGLPPKDYAELAEAGDVNVVGTLIQNETFHVDMNVNMKPFDDVRVRQAIAYALPYDAIMSQALYHRAEPLYGADPSKPYPPKWPVASPYDTDLDKAKELLKEAGYENGFSTELYYDMSQATIQEPMALLIQEQLKKLDINVTLEKVPGSDWFTKMGSRSMPMDINYFYGWLDYPEYFFFWTFDGENNTVFNTSGYNNPELDKEITEATQMEPGADYDALISKMIGTVMTDVPRAPVAHLYSDIAMQKNVKGYVYWFDTHVDYRAITKD
ncbi:ABC transporter substrate-binding protein [Martelella sp. HB161492]|uniref:ABC transporter substrate-binding protein n=1 Tax=Martelella sp. HB161492 TaxID=2720726 RepID=UPI001FEDABDB|nr:ABC transporter substrate-binding protein [Martelella sp. HB161492]